MAAFNLSSYIYLRRLDLPLHQQEVTRDQNAFHPYLPTVSDGQTCWVKDGFSPIEHRLRFEISKTFHVLGIMWECKIYSWKAMEVVPPIYLNLSMICFRFPRNDGFKIFLKTIFNSTLHEGRITELECESGKIV